MAEAAVGFVIEKLASSITQEVELLKDIHKEVADIKSDLEAIQAFLQDADSKTEKQGSGGGVEVWVETVREAAYQAEDVIDKYMLHVARNRDRHGFVGFLQKSCSLVKHLVQRRKLASEVQKIRETVKEVGAQDRIERFQLIPSTQGASSSNAKNVILNDPRFSSLFIEDAELVGIESSRYELINLLIRGTSNRELISVVGIGGIGKTTIALKVFNSVKRHFECPVWITVSQSYDRKELLKRVLKTFWEEKHENFPHDIDTMDDRSLVSELREYSQRKRYLVVFDDVWDVGFWGDVQHALSNNNNGSRILFTTRNEDVANFCRGSCVVHVHSIEPLPHLEAWELFCKKAFKFDRCPEELEDLSKEIVRRCGGMPLAIVAVGGLLAVKEKTLLEWKKVLDGLGSAMVLDDPHLESVGNILSLSYYALPYYLKLCFLYLGLFPRYFSIKCKRIIQLWVAGGFVRERLGPTLEQVAEVYLTELINRNLVRVDEVGDKGIPRTCRVYHMIYEVILAKSDQLSFCHVPSNGTTVEGIARHLSIRSSGSDNVPSRTNCETRSIMVFDELELPESTIRAFSKCKLLMALDLEGCPIDHIPEELGSLLCLRYLSLRDTRVSKLPKSIGKLHNLEHLDLRGSSVQELPVEIGRFPKLRCLFGSRVGGAGFKIHGGIGKLEFLQTLKNIQVDVRLVNELGMLKQLRGLKIRGLKTEDGSDGTEMHFEAGRFQKLEWLKLEGLSKLDTMTIEEGSLPILEKLSIRHCRRLKEVPSGIQHLKCLKELCFYELSEGFNERVWSDEGKDYWIVKHVPSLRYY